MLAKDKRLASALGILALLPTPSYTLTVGCGDFTEHAVFVHVWPQHQHIGLDVRRQQDWPNTCVQAEAQHPPFKTPFALMLVRHPDLFNPKADWGTALPILKRWVAGMLLVTVYDLHEYRWVQQALPKGEPFPHSEQQLAPPDLVNHDRYLWLVQNGV